MIKISFGIIVLNGIPFLKYNLRQLYPFAYEIIVVEGASKYSKNFATKKGHSIDNTLKALKEFKQEEDSENKVKIITKNGFWSEKDEQSQAYAKIATGDYLWQIDIDEFYTYEHMQKIIDLLEKNPKIKEISLRTKSFFGDIKYEVNGVITNFHRIFKWNKGYRYISHRPPTVVNEQGIRLWDIHHFEGRFLYNKYGIFLYHYSLLFPFQVMAKCDYYDHWATEKSKEWMKNNYFLLKNPFRVHNSYKRINWLSKSKDRHPQQAIKMMNDIYSGKLKVDLRNNQDIESLFKSHKYKVKRMGFIICYKLRYCLVDMLTKIKSILYKAKKDKK